MDKDAALAFVRTHLAESAEVKRQMSETAGEALFVGAMMMTQAVRTGHKVMLCGNGGSAADAQHIAAELTGRTRPTSDRAALPALALTTDTSALTALGNDYGFDEVFARQVEGLGQPGDVLIAISTSGNSPNILKAVETARRRQIKVIGLMGRGGQLMGMADHAIAVPSSDTPRIQEAHIAVAHIMCDLVEHMLSSTNSGEQPAQVAAKGSLP